MKTTDSLAGRGRRLAAAALDLVFVASVAFLALWPLGIFEHQQAYQLESFIVRLFLLLAGSYLLVNGWLLYQHGQTIGKRLLGMRIVRHRDCQLLPLWALLIRAFSQLTALVLPPLIILAAIDTVFIFSRERRCLHDYLIGSSVRRVDP
jgi:uncharacterized RDD family membrane protein YckC